MRTLKRMAGAIDGLNAKIGTGIRWLVLIMVVVGALNSLVRYTARGFGWSLNLTGLYELQWYFFSLVFLLGAAYGLSHDVHVRVDVLYSTLSRKSRAWIDLIGSLLFLIPFSVMMLWVSYPPIVASWRIREVSPDPGGLPRYPIKTVILLSFALLVLQAFSQVVKQVEIIRGGERGGDAGSEGTGAEADTVAGPEASE